MAERSFGNEYDFPVFPPDNETYLGNPDVVRAIVGLFLKDAIFKRNAVQNLGDKENLRDWLNKQTADIADIFLGKSKDYSPINGWNSPTGGIVKQVRSRYGLGPGAADDTIKAGLAQLFVSLAQAETEEEAGRDWKYLLDDGLDLLTATLCGFDQQRYPMG